MGSDIRRESGRHRAITEIYYFLASEFGWDKKQVDRQSTKYIYMLIQSANEETNRQARSNKQTENQLKRFK